MNRLTSSTLSPQGGPVGGVERAVFKSLGLLLVAVFLATPALAAKVSLPGQGVNIAMNIWHGVLTPIGPEADFLCVDRGGEGNNLEEHFFTTPWRVEPA